MHIMAKIEKKDIKVLRLDEAFLVVTREDFNLVFTEDAMNKLFMEVNKIILRETHVAKCKNCGEDIRGLKTAKEIPIHTITETRRCTNADTMAEWRRVKCLKEIAKFTELFAAKHGIKL